MFFINGYIHEGLEFIAESILKVADNLIDNGRENPGRYLLILGEHLESLNDEDNISFDKKFRTLDYIINEIDLIADEFDRDECVMSSMNSLRFINSMGKSIYEIDKKGNELNKFAEIIQDNISKLEVNKENE